MATRKQIEYIKDLADQAGYRGDRAYNAAQDLLGDGRGWQNHASALIDALLAKLGRTHSAPRAKQSHVYDDGTPIEHVSANGTRWTEY